MENSRTRIPIACSLTAEDFADREAACRTLLETSLVAAEPVPGGVRLSLHPGSAESLRKLVALERECCPWIKSRIEGSTVTLNADGDGEPALVAMFSEIHSVAE